MSKLIINNEECRTVPNFENYSISESGRVYRTKPTYEKERKILENGALYLRESKIHFRVEKGKLRQGFISLTDSEKKLHNCAVSTLVAMSFNVIPLDFDKKKFQIAYKDGNKKNLHYRNLIVVDKTHTGSKLSPEDVVHIKKQIKKGVPLRTIGWVFGVSEMQINRIKTGENWGNGKRKIKAPVAPFKIEDGRIRKYIATYDRKKTKPNIKKPFTVIRNSEAPTDNLIMGILNGYKLSLKHTNITRAREIVEKLNKYFFNQ